MKYTIPQQYKDSKLMEKGEIQSKVPLLKVRSTIHSGSIFPCYDSWCQANCSSYTGGGATCTCLDDGSHTCDHYIVPR